MSLATTPAGYMQWKQLLVLLLGCVTGPLERHTSLFVAFLAAVTAQLRFGLSIPSGSGGSGSNGSRPPGPPGSNAAGPEAGPGSEESGPGIDAGVALLGAGLVEELLPDSFLRQAFRGFFEMVQESAAEVPAPLLAQVCVCVLSASTHGPPGPLKCLQVSSCPGADVLRFG